MFVKITGGDDSMCIEGVMPYIADKEWQCMANFLGRVRETDDAFPGRIGEVAVFYFQKLTCQYREGDCYRNVNSLAPAPIAVGLLCGGVKTVRCAFGNSFEFGFNLLALTGLHHRFGICP
jgi:hypothetical protein